MHTPAAYPYDVALSFDGAHRAYVEEVAEILRAANVKVFFDDFEQVDLWGRDLAVHLETVYRSSAKFVVPFISEEYAQRAWPRREFSSALARAVSEREPFLLPVRFDSTDLPGLLPTVAYLDARRLGPKEVADAILLKLGRGAGEPAAVEAVGLAGRSQASPTRRPKVVPSDFDPYAESDRAVEVIRRELTTRSEALKQQGYAVNIRQATRGFQLRVLKHGKTAFSLDLTVNDELGENTIAINDAGGRGMTGWGHVEWDRERGMAVLKVHSMSLRPQEAGSEFRVTAAELADAFWEKLCERLEQHDRGY